MQASKKAPLGNGFTIVELLIVVVVIAILAAITVVGYNGIQNRTYDTAVQSDLRQLGAKIAEYRLLNNDTFPAASAAQFGSLGVKVNRPMYGNHYLSGGTYYNFLYCYNNSTGIFALFAASRTGKTFQLKDGTVTERGALVGSSTLCAEGGVASTGRATYWLYGQGSSGAWVSWS